MNFNFSKALGRANLKEGEQERLISEIKRIQGRRGIGEGINETLDALFHALEGESQKNIKKCITDFRQQLADTVKDGEVPMVARIAACRTQQDFKILFASLGIKGDKWKNCNDLDQMGLGNIYKIIIADERFTDGKWGAFRDFMGIERELTMLDKVTACKTRQDFLNLFKELGLTEEQWSNNGYLQHHGFMGLSLALYRHPLIIEKKWSGFKKFMGLVVEDTWKNRVLSCKERGDFLKLFKDIGLTEDKWSSWNQIVKSGFPGLVDALKIHPLFKKGGVNEFKNFMGLEDEIPMTDRILQCKTPNDFLKFFKKIGLPNAHILGSHYLQKKGWGGLYIAIIQHPVSNRKWSEFQKFMGIEKEEPFTAKIARCATKKSLIKLFEEIGIPDQKWVDIMWMEKNGYSYVRQAVLRHELFKGHDWKYFKSWMGVVVEKPVTQQVAEAITANDFLELFRTHGIQNDDWRNSRRLAEINSTLYSVIVKDPRFSKRGWRGFIEFMDQGITEKSEELIASLKIEELFAIFADRPGQLKLYLQANYKNMSEQEIDKLILQGFKSFFGSRDNKEAEYSKYSEKLPSIKVNKLPMETDAKTVEISGVAKGAKYIYLSGIGSRRCKVDDQGRFSVIVPLLIGKTNTICLTSVHPQNEVRSNTLVFEIESTGLVDDTKELIELLTGMGHEALESIKVNPGRYEHIKSRLKHVLIRKFSKNFHEGEKYVKEQMVGKHGAVIKKMLREILSEFRSIDLMEFPNIRSEEPLYLFQKYCAQLIQKRMAEGRPGVILANDPGLGKTRTALAAINGEDTVIVAPNSVVSGWSEEAARCMQNPDLLVMQDMPHAQRKKLLKESTARQRITNIQFMQKHMDDERFALLADEDTVVVQDEAHSRANLLSDQTKGMRKLSQIGKFQLLLSATPFKNSKTVRRVLHTLHPDRNEFSSDTAFEKAFPSNDPKALQTLNLLLEEDMIRFTKRDALEEMDPKVPIAKQYHKLPRKEHISPETIGSFEMSNEQAHVLYEMFLNWPKWTKKYGKYVPKDKVARLDHMRNGDALSKRHAYRQVVNNPDYIGLNGVSNSKARIVRNIVEKSLREGRKVEIFCAYNAQANLYADILKKYNPAIYTGITSDEGWKKDSKSRPQFFRKDAQGRWEFDDCGYPIPDSAGEPMLAMDYERLSFQNASKRKIVIATYAAGAVGTTFTAAKTVIKDDLPRDCIEDEQSDDRTHRIDHEHQTHHTIKHYHLISSYPEKFLNEMKKRWVVKQKDSTYKEFRNREAAERDAKKTETEVETAYEAFFEQGTWDEVHFANLKTQKQMMHLILDGIADESILAEDQKKMRGIED